MKVGLGASLGVHLVLLFLGLLQGPSLYSPPASPLPYFFWFFLVLSLSLCILTSFRDPGFCPLIPPGPILPLSIPVHYKNAYSTSTQNSNQGLGKDLKTNPSTTANTPFVTGANLAEEGEGGDSEGEKEREHGEGDREECQGDSGGQKDGEGNVVEKNHMEITSHLEVSMEISSSCKESEFRDLSDPELDPEIQSENLEQELGEQLDGLPAKCVETQTRLRSEEIEILLPEVTLPSAPQAILSIPIELDPKPSLRFCTFCNADQLLRAKHCETCGRCVAKYDHHCPWLSVCVGEKNHVWFVGYLAAQSGELGLGIAAVAVDFSTSSSSTLNWLRLALIILGLCPFLLLLSLLAYQVAMISLNLTTWEHRSWGKITYLQSRPKSCKSPFTTGCLGNFSLFFQAAFRPSITEWVINP